MRKITIDVNGDMKFVPQASSENNRESTAEEFESNQREGLLRNGVKIGNHLKVVNKITIMGVDYLDLEFMNDNNELKNVQVKYSLIISAKKMLELLFDSGYRCDLQKGKSIIESYLANYDKYTEGYDPNNNKISAIQTGWHGLDYVLPHHTVSLGEPTYKFFATDESKDLELSISTNGTLSDWQNNVAKLCVGRELLELGLYAGFCAPLVRWCGATYGFHIYGQSSIGKSTIVEVASSIFGKPSLYMNKWDATRAGMEIKAHNSNHMLLILDELNEATPQSFRSVYQIVDGKGKARKTEYTRRWQTVLISSGEVSTEVYAKQNKIALKAGELVRLVNIEAVKVTDDQEHSNNLKDSANKYYGVAAIAFTQALLDEFGENIETVLDEMYCKKLNVFKNMLKAVNVENPQAYRVAEYFAMCILAGELAIKYNILTDEFNPTKTSIQVFKHWLESNKYTAEEKSIMRFFKDAIGEPRNFIDVSEYAKLGASGLGYTKENGKDEKLYWIIPQRVETIGFYGTLKLDPNLCWKSLIKKGIVMSHKPELVPVGTGKLWLYRLDVSKLK